MNYKLNKYWEGVGQMIDVEVCVNGKTMWTTRIQTKDETIEEVLEKVRQVFGPATSHQPLLLQRNRSR